MTAGADTCVNLGGSEMANALQPSALDQLFGAARTYNEWSDSPVDDSVIRELYDLLKWGPTSANSSPARFVWVRTPERKAALAALAAEANRPKILAAPVTVIVGNDLNFPELMPKLFPARGEMMKQIFLAPGVTEVTAMRNGSMQGGYMILAARALGLDCGPMSGFDNAGVDKAFFAGTRIQSNFICNLGYGKPNTLFPRNPRLTFDEACRFE